MIQLSQHVRDFISTRMSLTNQSGQGVNTEVVACYNQLFELIWHRLGDVGMVIR